LLQLESRELPAGHASALLLCSTCYLKCNPRLRIADSSSRKAVSISSALTMKRFPSSRCASTIQIVRPSPAESISLEQPQLKPHSVRFSAMICRCFGRFGVPAVLALQKIRGFELLGFVFF
jgi:hypothetical protein